MFHDGEARREATKKRLRRGARRSGKIRNCGVHSDFSAKCHHPFNGLRVFCGRSDFEPAMPHAKAPRLIAHIGAEKTGTTSIQAFLAANRARLKELGVLYPECLGAETHVGLSAFAQADDRRDDTRRYFDIGPDTDDLAAFRTRIEAAFADEIAEAAPRLVIVSNEHLHSRVQSRAEKARLAGLLERRAEQVDVVCYIRRQTELALSLYSTALRFQRVDIAPLPKPTRRLPYYYDYDRMLSEYAEAFGEDRIHVRLYDDGLIGGDAVRDFSAFAGLDAADGLITPPRQNSSINAPAQRFLAALNRLAPNGDEARLVRGNAVTLLEAFFSGRGQMVSRAEAEEFQARFGESNERVRARWFPERETLFSADFSRYPDEVDADRDLDGLADVGARLFAQKQKELRRTNIELKLREAEIARLKGRKETAERRLSEARDLAVDMPEMSSRIDAIAGESADA